MKALRLRDLKKAVDLYKVKRKRIDLVDKQGVVTTHDCISSFIADYAGSCLSPVPVSRTGREYASWTKGNSPRLLVEGTARCRKCPPCLLARRNYWAAAATHQTQKTWEAGKRTWFGTLTLTREHQARFRQLAEARYTYSEPSWEELSADDQFKIVCNLIYIEVQKYWRRLRKKGHKFRYFVVFEKHKSGLPHIHALVHENEEPILKKHLKAQWPLGHTKFVLVGGRAARAAPTKKVAWYVCKYLSKSSLARLVASQDYKPKSRS